MNGKSVIKLGNKKYIIKSKARFIISLMVILACIVTATGFITGINTSTAMTKDSFTKVQIENGDTLWNIAEEHKSADTDTRRAVYTICKVNDIDASDLYPGMILSVPDNL